jgi:Arc/MetJ family transcription regulator
MADPPDVPVTDLATRLTTDVDLDEELLEEAQLQLQAPTANAAINEALRRLVGDERQKRREAREQLRRMYEEGVFDFSKLDAAEE